MAAGCKNLPGAAENATRTVPYIQHPAAEIAIPTRLRLLGACRQRRSPWREGVLERVLVSDSPSRVAENAGQSGQAGCVIMVNA